MNIVLVFFIIIILLLLYDFKKGVLIYAPLKLFFNMNVRFGAFTFDLAVSLIILLLFLFQKKKLQKGEFSLRKYFILYSLGYMITCLYPDFSPNSIPRIVIMVLAFSYVYYYCLQNMRDIRFAILCYSIFAIVMCFNGLLQPLMGINPLDDFLQSISDEELSFFLDNGWVRMGQVRYRSFIPHAISYGVACCMIFYLVLWSFLILIKQGNKVVTLFSISLLVSGIIICGSRTPIIGLLPLTYILFNQKYVSGRVRTKMILLILVFLAFESEYILYSINSVINQNIAEDAGGSSTEMRINQLSIAWGWMKENPILGKGMEFDAFRKNSDILGAESVWLPLMMNNGLVGLFSYITLCWGTYKVFSKSKGKSFLLIFSLGWIVMRTATSLIGVTDAQFFTCIFIIYRYYQITEHQTVHNYETIHHHPHIQCRAIH